jgi:hypothetical protein
MTSDGPRLIDWTFSIRAPAALDHGFTHISLTEFALDVADNPQRPLAVTRPAQSEYARLSGGPVAALMQAMETWLPIAIRPLLPAYGRADKRAMAADDAARRSGPAPAKTESWRSSSSHQSEFGYALMSSRPKKAYYFVSNHLQVICSCHRHCA